MRYISLFSGIEAASVAWRPLHWEAIAFAEIEAFPSAVLAHHYPNVPNVGDVTKRDWSQYRGRAGVLVGGFPCQAFSVAGLRQSLDDDRGNLSLEYCRILDTIDPRYAIAENVPGWLSTKDNAFGCFLGAVVGTDAALVPGKRQRWSDAGMVVGPKRAAAWRVLDAQYFGLAQRRRRVFVVICPRGGANPAAVLFEQESLCGNPAPRREAGKGFTHELAPSIGASGRGFDRTGETRGQDPVVADVAPTLGRDSYKPGKCASGQELDWCVAHTLRADGFDASEDGTGRGTPLVATPTVWSIMPENSGKDYKAREVDVAQPLMAGGPVGGNQGGDFVLDVAAPLVARMGKGAFCDPVNDNVIAIQGSGTSMGIQGAGCPTGPCYTLNQVDQHAVCFAENTRGEVRTTGDATTALSRGGGKPGQGYPAAVIGSTVRRLTPKECHRLQGFPDDFLDITYRGKPAADRPKYHALGNSMAVPVMRWIGERIQMVEDLLQATGRVR